MKSSMNSWTAILLSLWFVPASFGRTWTNKQGVEIEADYVSSDGKNVTIRKAGVARPFTVPLAQETKEKAPSGNGSRFENCSRKSEDKPKAF